MFFHRRFKIDKKMIPQIRPTSKAALKQMCLLSANGDIDKASKLYDFMIKDMEDLPLFDVPPPSTMQQIKSGVSETMGWLNQNQDKIMVWADMLGGIFRKSKGVAGVANLMDTATDAVQGVANAVPKINK